MSSERDMSDRKAEWLLSMADKDSVLGCEAKAYVERLKARLDQRDKIISSLLGMLQLPLDTAKALFEEATAATTDEELRPVLMKINRARYPDAMIEKLRESCVFLLCDQVKQCRVCDGTGYPDPNHQPWCPLS